MYTKDNQHIDNRTNNHPSKRYDVNNIKHKADDAKNAISSTVMQAKNKVKKIIIASWFKHRSEELQENVMTFIQQNPGKSIAYGVLAGFLIAHLRNK